MRPSLPIPRLRAGLWAWGLGDADVLEIAPGVSGDVFLVMNGADRWVAKYAYDHRAPFEAGLRVSQVVHERISGPALEVAVPVPTTAGALTEMVEFPDGHDHPLALLTYVRGDPIPAGDPDAATLIGDACGRVHAALLDVAPIDVGLPAVVDEPGASHVDRDAGEHSWLHDVARVLDRQTLDRRAELRHAVSVWDGPDIRRTSDGSVALLDFGICNVHPLVHVIANRSLNAALVDESQLDPFVAAVERHLPLTPAERELLPLYRALNAVVYARWVAMERVTRHDPGFNDAWFRQLIELLRRAGHVPT